MAQPIDVDMTEEERFKALCEPPDGEIFTCGYCGGPMTHDEAGYNPAFDDFLCKLCNVT